MIHTLINLAILVGLLWIGNKLIAHHSKRASLKAWRETQK